jgi:hypothetical protein
MGSRTPATQPPDWRTTRLGPATGRMAATVWQHPPSVPAALWRYQRLGPGFPAGAPAPLPPPPPPLPPQQARSTLIVGRKRPRDDEPDGEHGDPGWNQLKRVSELSSARSAHRGERADARAAHREFKPGGDGAQCAANHFYGLAAHLEFKPGGDGAQCAADHFYRLASAMEQSRAASSPEGGAVFSEGGAATAWVQEAAQEVLAGFGADAAMPMEDERAAEVESRMASPGTFGRTRSRAVTPLPARGRRVTDLNLPTAAAAARAALAAAMATAPLAEVQQPRSPPPSSSVSALLARDGYAVLQGHCSAEMRLQALQLAPNVNWLLPERLLAGQPDGRRLRCYMEPPSEGEPARAPLPGGAAELAAECRATLRSLLPGDAELPLYQPTMLLTLPGALQQHWHRDANQDDVYSVLIAVTDRDFWFKERGLLHLRAGDLLIFKGSMCHAGAELARDAGEASIALHIYGGNGITADVLASLFTDSACRGHPETA